MLEPDEVEEIVYPPNPRRDERIAELLYEYRHHPVRLMAKSVFVPGYTLTKAITSLPLSRTGKEGNSGSRETAIPITAAIEIGKVTTYAYLAYEAYKSFHSFF